MLDYPRLDDAFRAQALRPGAWRVQIKRRQQISTVTYPYNPLDAVGWHGSLMPVRINVKDIRPLMSHRYHLPPSAHTTRSEDHTSELQSLMRISYAVFCLKKKKTKIKIQ